jgi:hypothetical protein
LTFTPGQRQSGIEGPGTLRLGAMHPYKTGQLYKDSNADGRRAA